MKKYTNNACAFCKKELSHEEFMRKLEESLTDVIKHVLSEEVVCNSEKCQENLEESIQSAIDREQGK